MSKLILSIECLLLLCNSVVCAQSEYIGKTMGPIDYRVVIYDQIDDSNAIKTGIQNQLDEVNSLMSTYIDSSDVSKFNQAGKDEWVGVHPLTLQVVKRAIHFSELTDGSFDITVGPAVNRWKFGPESAHSDVPVEDLLKFVGFKKLSIQDDPPAISKSHSKTQIDLSAIAKGFAVDHVSNWLAEQDFSNYMVEVGGEVVVKGETENGNWRIGIEQPSELFRKAGSVVSLTNLAMATSGDYRNFRIEDGKRISHTIDPVTCRPIENSVASCSIVAADCLTADAIATAVMVMGEENGLEFCRRNNLHLAVITRDATNSISFAMQSTEMFPFDKSAGSVAVSSAQEASIWPTFIGAIVVFSLAITGMAVGAIFNNRPITGSCGGIAATQNEDGSSNCSMCQKPVTDCPETNQEEVSS